MDDIRTFEALTRQQGMQWEMPEPLEEYQRPAFPLDALPQLFQAYAQAIADHLQLYPDMPGLMLLAAVSTACAGKVVIEPFPGWREPIQTYSMVVMGVGERKSPVLKLAAKPIARWEAEKAMAMAGDVAASQSKKRMLQKRLAKTEEKGAESDAQTLARELAAFREITAPRILADDITPEALASRMAANHGACSIWSSEGGLLSILGGRYQAKDAGPNIDLVLKAFSSDAAMVDRVGRPTEIISSPALTIMLAVQPDVLQQLMKNDTFLNRGLCGRFLYALPDSMVGHRKAHGSPIPDGLQAEYGRIIQFLLDIPYPEEKYVLALDAEALQMFDQWGAEIEPKLAGEWKEIGGWANKLQGLTLRLAGQIHMATFRAWDNIPISAQIMAAAIQLGRYAVAHALAAFGAGGGDPVLALAKRVLEAIRQKRWVDFSRRELGRAVRGPKTGDFDQPLALLEDYGYIRRDILERPSDVAAGRPSGPRWVVNPLIGKGGGS